jgi:hypothetical protein
MIIAEKIHPRFVMSVPKREETTAIPIAELIKRFPHLALWELVKDRSPIIKRDAEIR